MKETAINTLTQKDYWELMRVYECGGIICKGRGEKLPTQMGDAWIELYEEETCINVEEKLEFSGVEFYLKQGFDIILPSEFYDKQKITPEMLKEINNWFEKNKGK